MNKINAVIDYIDSHLCEYRKKHSFSVAETALNVNDIFKLKNNRNDVILAGLSHDIGKSMNHKEMYKHITKYKLNLDDYELRCNTLWHGHISAALLNHKFDIRKRNIIKAVKHHTTGHPIMSDLLKLIYIADYIEPTREHKIKIEIADYKNINALLFAVISHKFEYLKKKSNTAGIHPVTNILYKKFRKYA